MKVEKQNKTKTKKQNFVLKQGPKTLWTLESCGNPFLLLGCVESLGFVHFPALKICAGCRVMPTPYLLLAALGIWTIAIPLEPGPG